MQQVNRMKSTQQIQGDRKARQRSTGWSPRKREENKEENKEDQQPITVDLQKEDRIHQGRKQLRKYKKEGGKTIQKNRIWAVRDKHFLEHLISPTAHLPSTFSLLGSYLHQHWLCRGSLRSAPQQMLCKLCAGPPGWVCRCTGSCCCLCPQFGTPLCPSCH